MSIFDRFQLAFQSQLGTILWAMLGFLVALALIYWLLRWRQKQKDIFAFRYRQYYEKIEQATDEFIFVGAHKADFFGRQTIVKIKNDKQYLGLALVPPPDLAEFEIRERFRCFYRALKHQGLPLFAPYIWKSDESVFIIVQGQLIQEDGRQLLSYKHFLTDKRLSEVDKESVLLELARALSNLHRQRMEIDGKSLYHGFILPRSLFLDLDVNKTIKRIVLSDVGLCFAYGPKKIYDRLCLLRAGKLPIEKYCANELIEQLTMLAPEQKDPHRLHEVGVNSDFFSFAALAVTVFTQKRFLDSQKTEWSSIPHRWHAFLKSALKDDVKARPQDFLEIEDWLSNPELSLTHLEFESGDSVEQSLVNASEMRLTADSLSDLSETMHKLQQEVYRANAKHSFSASSQEIIFKNMENGVKAIKTSKWPTAKKHFKEVLKVDPQHAEAHVNLAIICYELKEFSTSEKHYEIAKQINPRMAKAFREYIAFRV